MSKQDIRNYPFSKDDQLFFDANIWIYIYGPLVTQQNLTLSITYAVALQKIRHAQSRLFIDSLVLSEFINTYARLEYRQSFANTYRTFKQFRNSPDFKSVAQEIADNTKRLVTHCQPCDSHLSAFSLMDILDEYAQGTAELVVGALAPKFVVGA